MRRDTNAKEDVPWALVPQKVALLLVTIQHEMLDRAAAKRDEAIVKVAEWKESCACLLAYLLAHSLTPLLPYSRTQVAEWKMLAYLLNHSLTHLLTHSGGRSRRTSCFTCLPNGLLPYSRTQVTEWKDFVPTMQAGQMALTPFCNETEFEELVKDKSKAEALAQSGEEEDEKCATPVAAKTLCIPFDQPELPPGTACFVSGKPAQCWVLWGRSY